MTKFRKLLAFLATLKVEPFIFLYICGLALNGISSTQLIQDKICMSRFGDGNKDFCTYLAMVDDNFNIGPQAGPEAGAQPEMGPKSLVLSQVTVFGLYRTLLSTVPTIVWSLFLGSWTDRHPNCRKFLILFGCFGAILESTFLLFNSIFFDASKYPKVPSISRRFNLT